jgi:hypothetical protein
MDGLAAQVGAKLKLYGLMLATAESCTGGGVAQAITEVAGSSSWFERGFITYSNASKQQVLGVLRAVVIAARVRRVIILPVATRRIDLARSPCRAIAKAAIRQRAGRRCRA